MVIRTILVDDHFLLREALQEKLARESDIDIVGAAGDGPSALELVAELLPDVVVMDIGLPEINGVELAALIIDRHPAIKVVALSMYSDKHFVVDMLKAGASGYVTKTAASTELLNAIRAVASGKRYLDSEATATFVDGMQEKTNGKTQLGRREREVLSLLAEGLRTTEIADKLFISAGTVEVHRRNIMRKLDLHNVAELTKYAIREGIIRL